VADSIFLDEYRHSVDSKGRVAVPNSYRKRLPPESEGKFVLSKGRDRTIEVHPLSEWRAFWDRTLRKLPRFQLRAKRIRRQLARASEVVVDDQGRVLIPKHLREHAGIESDVVIAGAGEYFEIWAPAEYQNSLDEAARNDEEDLAEMERLGWGAGGTEADEAGGGRLPSSGTGR